jgi:hypothetical protein
MYGYQFAIVPTFFFARSPDAPNTSMKVVSIGRGA